MKCFPQKRLTKNKNNKKTLLLGRLAFVFFYCAVNLAESKQFKVCTQIDVLPGVIVTRSWLEFSFCVGFDIDQVTKQDPVWACCQGFRFASAWQVDWRSSLEVSKAILIVLMTSLSVLTTEGWMMVAPQGTATTGGQIEEIEGCVLCQRLNLYNPLHSSFFQCVWLISCNNEHESVSYSYLLRMRNASLKRL